MLNKEQNMIKNNKDMKKDAFLDMIKFIFILLHKILKSYNTTHIYTKTEQTIEIKHTENNYCRQKIYFAFYTKSLMNA